MISLIALIFCTCMFIFTVVMVVRNPDAGLIGFVFVLIQVGCILINVPGTVSYLQGAG